MQSPNENIERKYLKSGYGQVIGIDEVGMGCLAGPVVVCAVYATKLTSLLGVNDSKKLSAKKREEIVTELIGNKLFRYKVCSCQPKTIDKLNIHKASKLAMKRAVEAVAKDAFVQRRPLQVIALVDGPHRIPNLRIDQRAIIKGDQKVFVIACASIIAKVYRDKMMAKYAIKYPNYGFEIHKGYGTKQHYAQLASIGPCAIHRKSFRLI
ncbi:MAG: Ribonuclease HII [Parcubacteria group bacterium GW2011_GWE1_43_8]|nr:MAG: Ribonuclease HII [Parcubacteria group bacterium GW2011_GWE1_43_8]